MNSRDDRGPELDDPRVIAALDEYMAALETGRKPERRAFLARHPDVAAALAECLDGMEALHESSAARPRPINGGTAAMDWQPGAVLGDFRILREVGRGGMGVVYEAEQVSLGRRIALKVLPFALTLDSRQLQRFKNEARAAAQLHHQHIVPVYYVGSERGVHFYAMQYIEGQSLAELIQSLRQLTDSDEVPALPAVSSRKPATQGEPTGPYLASSQPRAVTTAIRPADTLTAAYSAETNGFYSAVARLGAEAAEALEHAHEYGVVHRDVKPANLMVDAQGHLWVTDFGLAQFQTDAGLTQSGDLLGTLRYMSPEQAGGRRVLLDHRTDVYSLGATLYELLTQRPPFDGADRQTLLHQILFDEPRPPRALRKSIPAELETIVLKCLEKDVDRRYATARELADDLRRFLANEPIRARRATPMQRLRKWARRHPSLVWAAVALCVLTVAGSLVSAELLRREQANTQAAYEREQQRTREAEERFLLAREELDSMFKLCEEELADRPALDGIRRRLLENFLVYYQRLIEQRGDDPTAAADLDASRSRVQLILDDLAAMQGAGQHPLLKEPAVLDDLRLEPDQREEIRKLMADSDQRWAEAFRNFGSLNSEERRELLAGLARRTEADITKVLTPGQRRRLRQIDVQRKGDRAFEAPDVVAALKLTAAQRERIRAIRDRLSDLQRKGDWAFNEPEVASALQLTDDQKKQIKAIREEAWNRRPGHHRGPGGPSNFFHGGPALVAQIERTVLTDTQRQRWRQLTAPVLVQIEQKVLNDKQRPNWEALKGEPFKGPPSRFGPGSPPPDRARPLRNGEKR